MLVLLVILICAAHALKHNTTLSELRLRGCGLRNEAICGRLFKDQGTKGLADVLKDHPTLDKLNLYGCVEMSDDGVQYLMDAMMSNTRVKMLSLSDRYRHLVPQKLVGRIKFSPFCK